MPEPAADLNERIVSALRTVFDPEIPVNVHDLGLIYGLDIAEGGVVNISMTLTAPNCPMAEQIVRDVERKVREVADVTDVTVEIVWEPKWNPDMMSEAAQLELEFTGHTGPAHLRKDRGISSLTIGKTNRPRPRPRKS